MRCFSLIYTSLFHLTSCADIFTQCVTKRERERSVCLWKADVSLSFSGVIIRLETTSIFTSSLPPPLSAVSSHSFSLLHSLSSSRPPGTCFRYCPPLFLIFTHLSVWTYFLHLMPGGYRKLHKRLKSLRDLMKNIIKLGIFLPIYHTIIQL